MRAGEIGFTIEGIEWDLPLPDETRTWIAQLAKHHRYQIQELNFIYSSDEYVLYLNQKYLQHDDFTDILTFNYSTPGTKDIIADVYISVERVKENAEIYKVPFIDELHRVMAHGILHIVGYDDTTEEAEQQMRQQEEFALQLRMF